MSTLPHWLPFAFLGAAIVAVWMPVRRHATGWKALPLWAHLFALAVGTGIAQGALNWTALPSLVATLLAAWGMTRASSPAWRRVCAVAAFVLGVLLLLRQLPGFNPYLVVPPEPLSAGARPYRLELRFDYAVVGLIFAALVARRVNAASDWLRIGRVALIVTPLTILAIVPFALAANWFDFAPKLPAIAWVHVPALLLGVYVAEEAFFRGMVQEPLHRLAERGRLPVWAPAIIPTVLFGLAHAGRGWLYIGFAAVAGLGLALAYAMTRRVEAAILVHAGISFTHFFFFTYPRLQ